MASASAEPPKDEPSSSLEEDKGEKRVGTYTLAGLSLMWDNCSAIRHRLRQGLNPLVHWDSKFKKNTNHAVEKTVKDLKANHDIMLPVCRIIASNAGLLPSVDRLSEELRLLCGLWQVTLSTDLARKQAWAIRLLVSVLKNSVWVDKKKGVKHYPKDSWLKTLRPGIRNCGSIRDGHFPIARLGGCTLLQDARMQAMLIELGVLSKQDWGHELSQKL